MNRVMWPVGILLLVGSLLGAAWALNQTTPHASATDGQAAAEDEVCCLAMFDLEKGIIHLYPKQPGEVAELAETKARQKNGTQQERTFEKGEGSLRLKSQRAEVQRSNPTHALRM